MNTEAVQTEILTPMCALFTPPRPMDEATERAALREYADALQPYKPDTLRSAWREVRDHHKGRSWPPIGVLVGAASSLVKASAPPPMAYRSEFEANQKIWDREKFTPQAKQAAREGWAWSLKLHILETGKTPSSGKIHEWRTFAFNRNERIAVHMNNPDTSASHKRAAMEGFDAIAQKEHETRQEIGA